MSKKESKISQNIIQQIAKFNAKEPQTIELNNGEKNIEIKVKYQIPLAEQFQFINDVVNNCFVDGEYTPEYYHISLSRAYFTYFTNIAEEIEINMLNDFIYNQDDNYTDSLDRLIVDKISRAQNHYMVNAIGSKIDFKQKQLLSNEHKLLEQSIQEMTSLLAVFSNIGKQFEGIDQTQMMDIFQKIANKDEKEIANTVLEFQSAKQNEKEKILKNSETDKLIEFVKEAENNKPKRGRKPKEIELTQN